MIIQPYDLIRARLLGSVMRYSHHHCLNKLWKWSVHWNREKYNIIDNILVYVDLVLFNHVV